MSRAGLLCIAGGGTGGHVMPALALAEHARARWPEVQVQFIGVERGLEAKVLPARGERPVLLRMHGIKGMGPAHALRVLLWELPAAVARILRLWRARRPDVVVGVGGYASASGVCAALLRGIPVVLYEQNAMPGLLNRVLGRLARAVMLGLPGGEAHFPARKTVLTGNIVRAELAEVRYAPHDPPCLLVMGGSQGARFFNERMPQVCRRLAEQGLRFTVRHLCGGDAQRAAQVRAAYRRHGIEAEVQPFAQQMADFYRAGDVLVARAGAMTVSEACMCGLPSLFVPLPIAANDHQTHNARAMVAAGGALICAQAEASVERLADMLHPLLSERQTRMRMSAHALEVAPRQAAEAQLRVLARFLPAQGDQA